MKSYLDTGDGFFGDVNSISVSVCGHTVAGVFQALLVLRYSLSFLLQVWSKAWQTLLDGRVTGEIRSFVFKDVLRRLMKTFFRLM